MNKTPPRLATLLLEMCAPREGREEILGDLNERFLDVLQYRGRTAARRWYWAQVVRSCGGFAKQRLSPNNHSKRDHGTMSERHNPELIRSTFADIRYAFRSFRRNPGAILVAVISLGIGIGASVTIFSVVDVYVFRSLPFSEPDRLVHVYSTMEERGWNYNNVSIPHFVEFREQSRTMDIAASRTTEVNLSGGDRPARISSKRTSWNYFDVFEIQPIIGRTFRPEEERDGAHRVAIISNGLWQNRFGADPSLVGETIQLDAEPYTVIGILPSGFRFGPTTTEVWTPFGLTGDEDAAHVLTVVGRLRPGVTLVQAVSDVRSEEHTSELQSR